MPVPLLLGTMGAGTLGAGAAASSAAAGASAAGTLGGVGSMAPGAASAASSAGGGGGGALSNAMGTAKKIGSGPFMGAFNLIKGMRDKRKRDALTPPSENPMERQMLNSIRRKRRALETGTAGPGLALVRQMGASANRRSLQAGGRANLGEIAMLQSRAFQNMAGQNDQQANQLLAQEQKQVNRMAGVARDMALLRRAELSADAALGQKDGVAGLMTMGEDLS